MWGVPVFIGKEKYRLGKCVSGGKTFLEVVFLPATTKRAGVAAATQEVPQCGTGILDCGQGAGRNAYVTLGGTHFFILTYVLNFLLSLNS